MPTHGNGGFEQSGKQAVHLSRFLRLDEPLPELGEDLLFAQDGRLEASSDAIEMRGRRLTRSDLGLGSRRELTEQAGESLLKSLLGSRDDHFDTETSRKHEAFVEGGSAED